MTENTQNPVCEAGAASPSASATKTLAETELCSPSSAPRIPKRAREEGDAEAEECTVGDTTSKDAPTTDTADAPVATADSADIDALEADDNDYVQSLFARTSPRPFDPPSTATIRGVFRSRLVAGLGLPHTTEHLPLTVKFAPADIVGAEIEHAIQTHADAAGKAAGKPPASFYRDTFVRIAQALSHKSHTELRGSLLAGKVSAAAFVRMSPGELVPPTILKKRAEYARKDAESTIVVDDASWAPDASVTCHGCKQKGHIVFRQIQMRSADEPPTTFYKCRRCGHSWRFGG